MRRVQIIGDHGLSKSWWINSSTFGWWEVSGICSDITTTKKRKAKMRQICHEYSSK